MGACGWSNDTTSEDFFALAHGAPSPPFPVPFLPAHNELTEATDIESCRYDGVAIEWKPLLRSYSGHPVPGQDYPWDFDR